MKASSTRSPGTLIALAVAALALGGCAESEAAGDEEVVTLFAREVSASAGSQDEPTGVLSTGGGATAEALDPADGTVTVEGVRIRGLRAAGDRLVLTVDLALAERADAAQSEEGQAGGRAGAEPSPATSLDLPAAVDVAVTGPGDEGVGPAAVEGAVGQPPADPDGRTWTVTVRGGEVVELSIER